MPRNPSYAGRGLTLFEVIVATSLIVLLLSAMLTFFWQTLEVREQAVLSADASQIARQVLSKLSSELRGCVGADQIGFPVEQRLIGDRRSLTFLTSALPAENQYTLYGAFDEVPPAQHDLRLIRYELWVDPENETEEGEPIVGGILRTEKKTLNQFVVEEDDPLDVRTDLWSHELGYLEFRYFDGIEWDTKWDITQGNSLPQLIQVTVGYKTITSQELEDEDLSTYPLSEYPLGDDQYHPDRYSLVVRIPAADRFFRSRVERVGQQLREQLGIGALP